MTEETRRPAGKVPSGVAPNLDRPGSITPDEDGGGAFVRVPGSGSARLTLTYQRREASGEHHNVDNLFLRSPGRQRRVPVSVTLTLPPRTS